MRARREVVHRGLGAIAGAGLAVVFLAGPVAAEEIQRSEVVPVGEMDDGFNRGTDDSDVRTDVSGLSPVEGEVLTKEIDVGQGADAIADSVTDTTGTLTRGTARTTGEPVAATCPDDVLISGYQTTGQQFVEVANVSGSSIELDGCSLVVFDAFTQTSIGATSLSGSIFAGDTVQITLPALTPAESGVYGIYSGSPPPDGSPFTTDDGITVLTYLDNATVFGVGHLTVPAHNDLYDCIYGAASVLPPGSKPVLECLE